MTASIGKVGSVEKKVRERRCGSVASQIAASRRITESINGTYIHKIAPALWSDAHFTG